MGREGERGEMKNQHEMINGGLGAGTAIGRQQRGGEGEEECNSRQEQKILRDYFLRWRINGINEINEPCVLACRGRVHTVLASLLLR